MDYDQFDVEYDRAWEAMKAGLRGTELTAEVERLRGLADSIENERDRRDAHLDIEMILSITRPKPPEKPLSETMLRIREVYGEATRYDGTTAERIARLEAGLAEFKRIAETAGPDELHELRGISESMYMLLSALQSDVT
jgi:hypothetical protein